MTRLVFDVCSNLSPSEVIRRDEVATAFGIGFAHETLANGKARGYFYTDTPKGSPHDGLMMERLYRVMEGDGK